MVVNDHLGWGNQINGVTRLFELWVSYLPADRYELVVCILNNASGLAGGLEARGSRVLFLPRKKYDPTTAQALARAARRERIDILHLQGYRGTAYGKVAAWMTDLPTVIHYHDTSAYYPLAQRLSDRVLGRLGNVHVAVSRSVRACWAARARLPEDRMRVLYNCVSRTEFPAPTPREVAESRRSLGAPDQARIVGSVTRLFPGKGTRFLIEAVPRVLERCPAAWFVIVGDGPERRELQAMVDASGLRERVRFHGYAARVRPLMAAFDVQVMTSSIEGGSPLPVLEAMSMAKPVIATDLVEVLEDGVSGLLIPPGDAGLLADRIVSVLANTGLSSRLGRAGREAVAAFDVRKHVDELDRIYASLVPQCRPYGRPEPSWVRTMP